MEREEEIQLLSRVSKTIREEPVKISINIKAPTTRQGLLMKLGLMDRKRMFELKPLPMGKLMQMSELLLTFDYDRLRAVPAQELPEEAYKLMTAHGPTIAKVIAIALSSERTPPEELITFLLDNAEPHELYQISDIITSKMELQSFLSSIILMCGVNILQGKVSPEGVPETIARTESLDQP